MATMKPKNPKKVISQMDRYSGANKPGNIGFESNIGRGQKVAPGSGSGARITRKTGEGSYATTVMMDKKKTVRSGKNLLGKNVTVTKTASYGGVKQGDKTIGDKIITKTKTVSPRAGADSRTGRVKTKQIAATSKKKDMKGENGYGQDSGVLLSQSGTNRDFKRNVLKTKRIRK